ncbi:hypothetical protein Zm00014a_042068 [Zea mays]|jgi:hypothetical protein|uniref:Uncharacterized protein n=2 Tax=Zea mays TaxID=4577 RepID=A0A3L6DN33_MAIZE|nr:hypothetical protein Zm00014a_042068 [Zea mays]
MSCHGMTRNSYTMESISVVASTVAPDLHHRPSPTGGFGRGRTPLPTRFEPTVLEQQSLSGPSYPPSLRTPPPPPLRPPPPPLPASTTTPTHTTKEKLGSLESRGQIDWGGINLVKICGRRWWRRDSILVSIFANL